MAHSHEHSHDSYDPEHEHDEEHDELQHCIEECLNCHAVCTMTVPGSSDRPARPATCINKAASRSVARKSPL